MRVRDSLRVLIESAPDGFFIHDVDGRILDVNERSCADLGWTREELLGLTINDISRGASPEENAANWANAPLGMAVTFRKTALRKDGTTFPVEISVTCQLVGDRKLFLGLARDISQQEADRLVIRSLNNDLELRVEQRTRELNEEREKLQAVMDSAQDAILFQDRAGRLLVMNRSAERLSEVTAEEAIGKTTTDIFGTAIGQAVRKQEEKVLASGEASTLEENFLVPGGQKTFLTTRSVHCDENGDVTGLVTVARDITDLKRNEQRMRQEHDRLLLAARVGGLGVWDYDFARDKLYCDEQWYRIMGRDPSKPIHSIAEFRAFIHPDDVGRATEVEEAAARFAANKENYGIVFRIIRPDREVRWVRSAAAIMEGIDGVANRAVGFVVDITEMRLAEEQLKQRNLSLQVERSALVRRGEELGKQALEDTLTGIANRRRLDQELERICLDAARFNHPITVALIDVDHFKKYNDYYGHAQGDVALQAVAKALSSVARRPYDLAARYGGEEFVLLLPRTSHPEPLFDLIAETMAELMIPHAASTTNPYLTVSCGSVIASTPSSISPAQLLKHADAALYRAKEGGRNRYVVTRL